MRYTRGAGAAIMDRALQERIIGAVVLMVFVVLVVPVFLDGPPDQAKVVKEAIGLPGQSGQIQRTIVLETDRETPVPGAQLDAVAESAPPETVAMPAPEQQSAAVEPTADGEKSVKDPEPLPQPVTSTTGMWAVQLGSFGERENAERLAADLRKQGFAAFLSQLAGDEGQLHRVRIGPQKDRQSAEAMAQRLSSAGHSGQVVPHP